MKRNLLFVLLSFCGVNLFAQHNESVPDAFKKLAVALQQFNEISYTGNLYIHNPDEDYFSSVETDVVAVYDKTAGRRLSKIMLSSNLYTRIFNGSELFLLQHQDSTYKIEVVNAGLQQLQSASGMYNSLLSLREAIPAVNKEDAIKKGVTDTVIGEKKYLQLRFSLKGRTISFPQPFTTITDTIQTYYNIIVNPQTFLPYMLLYKNSYNAAYYTQNTYTDYVLNTALEEPIWFYSSYKGYKEEVSTPRKPVMKVGEIMPVWKLPLYKGSLNWKDSLNSSALPGELMVMEFWIKECGYCMLAFKDLKRLQDKYRSASVDIVTVNLYDPLPAMQFFYEREKPEYTMLYQGQRMAEEMGVYAYPSTFVVDKTGTILYSSGGFDFEKVDTFLKGYFEKKQQ